MDDHVLKMLQKLQENPKPKKVLIAGLPRTGSQSLMTIANIILMMMDADFAPAKNMNVQPDHNKQFDFKQFEGSQKSSLLKVFNAESKQIREYPDVVLMSHRKPDRQLASMWTNWHKGSNCRSPPHCKGWTTAKREIERQVCLYDAFNKKIKYDMPLETLAKDPKLVIEEVADALGANLTNKLVAHALNIYKHTQAMVRKSEKANSFIQQENDVDDLDSGAATEALSGTLQYEIAVGSWSLKLKDWLDGYGAIEHNGLWKKRQLVPEVRSGIDFDWCRGW